MACTVCSAPETASTASAGPVVLSRQRFHITLPEGHVEADDAQQARFLDGYPAAQSALAIAKPAADAEGAFVGSLVVLPLGGDLRGLLVDDALCQTAAKASAKQAQGTVVWVKKHDFGYGPTCQWRLAMGAGSQHHAIMTRVIARGGQYAVTCHFDGRDAAGEGRCTKAAASFAIQ